MPKTPKHASSRNSAQRSLAPYHPEPPSSDPSAMPTDLGTTGSQAAPITIGRVRPPRTDGAAFREVITKLSAHESLQALDVHCEFVSTDKTKERYPTKPHVFEISRSGDPSSLKKHSSLSKKPSDIDRDGLHILFPSCNLRGNMPSCDIRDESGHYTYPVGTLISFYRPQVSKSPSGDNPTWQTRCVEQLEMVRNTEGRPTALRTTYKTSTAELPWRNYETVTATASSNGPNFNPQVKWDGPPPQVTYTAYVIKGTLPEATVSRVSRPLKHTAAKSVTETRGAPHSAGMSLPPLALPRAPLHPQSETARQPSTESPHQYTASGEAPPYSARLTVEETEYGDRSSLAQSENTTPSAQQPTGLPGSPQRMDRSRPPPFAHPTTWNATTGPTTVAPHAEELQHRFSPRPGSHQSEEASTGPNAVSENDLSDDIKAMVNWPKDDTDDEMR